MARLFWTEREKNVIKGLFGGISREAFESKPELILYVFDKRKVEQLVAANYLEYAWIERKEGYETLNQINRRTGNTYQQIGLIKNKIRLAIYEWLKEFKYFVELNERFVTTARLEKAESIIANFLLAKNNKKNDFYNEHNVDNYIKKFEKDNFKLTSEQRKAIHNSIEYQVTFINGSAGSGKTTTLKALIFVLEEIQLNFKALSPTGKAAKRLSQVADVKATTIHSFLTLKPQNDEPEDLIVDVPWETDEEDGLIVPEEKYGIIDEASMLSLSLLAQLIERDEFDCYIFVGDDKQLPPVEPGNFLDIVLKSKRFNAITLGTVQRQLEGSNILKVANDIIYNRPEKTEWDGKEDIEFIPSLSFGPETIIERYVEAYKLYGPNEVALLTPMKKRGLGTVALNALIRDKVNPPKSTKKEIENFETTFRVGDVVMNTRNKYLTTKKNETFYVPNGETGIIRQAYKGGNVNTLVIEFDGQLLYCKSVEIGDIIHAYALTIHKSQGSEYQRVFLIVHPDHSFMLKENLLYTGVTRAKEKLVVYGNIYIFNRAAKTQDSKLRKSMFYPKYMKLVKEKNVK